MEIKASITNLSSDIMGLNKLEDAITSHNILTNDRADLIKKAMLSIVNSEWHIKH